MIRATSAQNGSLISIIAAVLSLHRFVDSVPGFRRGNICAGECLHDVRGGIASNSADLTQRTPLDVADLALRRCQLRGERSFDLRALGISRDARRGARR